MSEIPFSQSEEAFLLSCIHEVIKVWSSQGQASFNLSVKDGHAAVHLGFRLGHPVHAHVPTQKSESPQPYKYKSPSRKEKDRARSAAHHAKLKESISPTPAMMHQVLSSAAPAATQISQPPNAPVSGQNPCSKVAPTSGYQSSLSTPTTSLPNLTAAAAVTTIAISTAASVCTSTTLNASSICSSSAAPAASSLTSNTSPKAASAFSSTTSTAVTAVSPIPAASAESVLLSPTSEPVLETLTSSTKVNQTPESKRTIRRLYDKAERLSENYTMHNKIAYCDCQHEIEDRFWETIKADPMKFIIDDTIDEVKLKQTSIISAQSLGVRK